MSFVAAIILAAGASRRMGRPKLLLPLADRPLLQHVVDRVATAPVSEIIVVIGPNGAGIRSAVSLPASPPSRWKENPQAESGQSSSLRAGLEGSSEQAEYAAVFLGDQPGIDAGLLGRLVEALEHSKRAAARPVFVRADGSSVPGHPVVVAKSLWPRLLEVSGDRGARALWTEHPELMLEVPAEGEPPPDIDTPADYEKAKSGD
jgi:molybdenum cofactor cytidylyltransferase